VSEPGGDTHFALARFDADGDPLGVTTDSPADDDEIRALAVQADGRIVAAGRSGDRIAVTRYGADGSVEAGFPKLHDFSGVTGEEPGGVVVVAGGRIMLAGTGVVAGERRLLLAALTPAGGIDGSFGSGGLVTLDLGDPAASVDALKLQPDGKLLVAAATVAGGVVVRFLPDGRPDPVFSTDGIARLGIAGSVTEDVAVQADGKVVAAGSAGGDSLVARFRPGGLRDPGFGSDGVALRSLGGSGPDELNGVGVTADGGIVAAGLESTDAPGVVATRLVGGDSSDPALAMTADALGDLVTYTLTATNRGADPAQGVGVNVTAPGGAQATALATAGSSCGATSCTLGTLAPGATRRMTLLVRAQAPGTLRASARIAATTFDSDGSNNFASATGTATKNRVVRRDRTKPKVKLRLRARRIADVRRRVLLAITTSEPAAIVVRTRWIAGGRRHTFARTRTVKLRKQGTKAVRLALTREGKALVKRKRTRRLNLAITVRARDKAGNKRVKSLRKTLRRGR
jgi:uncharacterized delta-60 repeat protein/uncharacterized repeat protein (TIGR01451 family)